MDNRKNCRHVFFINLKKCRRRLWMVPLPNLTFTFQGKRSVTLIMNDEKNDLEKIIDRFN